MTDAAGEGFRQRDRRGRVRARHDLARFPGVEMAAERLRLLSRERRRHAELEPVQVLELEHPDTPRTVRRLAQQRPARRLDPRRRRVDVRSARHVDLQIEPLSLDPVPPQLAVVLIEDDAAVTRGDNGGNDLPVVLVRLATAKPMASR